MPIRKDLLVGCILDLDREARLRVSRALGLLPPYAQRVREDSLRREIAGLSELAFARLPKEELVALLENVEFDVEGVTVRFDDGLPNVRKSTLVELAERVFLTNWTPSLRRPFLRIGREEEEVGFVRLDGDEDDEFDDDEYDDDFGGDEDDFDGDDESDEEWASEDGSRPGAARYGTESIRTVGTVLTQMARRPAEGLADFQRDAIRALDAFFQTRPNRGILELPTGTGKTRTAVTWIVDSVLARRQRVLWVAPKKELLDQADQEFELLATRLAATRPEGIKLGRWQKDVVPDADVVFATAALLARRRQHVNGLFGGAPPHLIVFDEAHRAEARKTRQALKKLGSMSNVSVLGLTATPWRRERNEDVRIDRRFGPTIFRKTFLELVEAGFLARPRLYVRRLDTSVVSNLRSQSLSATRSCVTSRRSTISRRPSCSDSRRTPSATTRSSTIGFDTARFSEKPSHSRARRTIVESWRSASKHGGSVRVGSIATSTSGSAPSVSSASGTTSSMSSSMWAS